MNNIDRKVLVLDVDGTLLNTKKEITPKTKEALAKVRDAGHEIVIASGRPYPGMKKYVAELGLDKIHGHALAFNGSAIVDTMTGEYIRKQAIPNKFLKTLHDYALSRGIGLVTYDGDTVIAGTELDEYMKHEARLNFMEIRRADDFIRDVKFDMIKCIMTAPPEIAKDCEIELRELVKPDINVFRSEEFFIEITPCGIDKAATLATLIEILGIPQENTICCGDGFNDLSMIKFGGIGVAMANAFDVCKEAADYITSSCDEDGIAEVCEKFILN